MSSLAQVLSTALIPLTSILSLTVYLGSHPNSPIKRIYNKPDIALPTHSGEALDGVQEEKDVFDISDALVCEDGQPVDPGAFWARMRRKKIALLIMLLPAIACNIALLVYTILSDMHGDVCTRSLLIPLLIVPSHIVTVLLGFFYVGQDNTPAHWSTTIHLSTNIFAQFLVLALRALLPSTPLPHSPSELAPTIAFAILSLPQIPHMTPSQVFTTLLPISHIPALMFILTTPRGPPLHLPLTAIYPKKITDAIPPDHDSLDPTKANVTAEVQVTVPDYLMFNYTTAVVRKGYYAESMDVWDLPILTATMRELRSPPFSY
jgi:hypothetical protein